VKKFTINLDTQCDKKNEFILNNLKNLEITWLTCFKWEY
jgi:hypothetical protein